MYEIIENKIFDEERALYNVKNTDVLSCKFEGPKDGESVLKEGRDFNVKNCSFSLRYPLWHAENFTLCGSFMDEKTRAPIWYAKNGVIDNCNIRGTKCLRECSGISVLNTYIDSAEFGWKCCKVNILRTSINSEYLLLESKDIEISNIIMKGKYSFQYMENLRITDSEVDTKDAFWHSKNVIVENSVLKGEYLGWFSENLTLVNCRIIGTQPLCYCKNLRLVDCEMESTDLSFEYSDVDADIKGHIVSVKNPRSGKIAADSIGQVIYEDSIMECNAKVIERKNSQNCA